MVWETEDAFRAAVQVQGRNGLAGVWGAAEQPKCRQLLTLQPDNGFLLIKQEQHDHTALARSRTFEPGSYFELSVSPWGHVRCTCPGFTYRGVCKHAEALRAKLKARPADTR